MRSANPEGFPSIPSATGGIARLAYARMREAGKGTAAVLSGAGLRAEQVDDPTVRLEVRTQIMVLELAAQELQDDFSRISFGAQFRPARDWLALLRDGVFRAARGCSS